MRSIDTYKDKRRFVMFNEKARDKVLELNAFFGKYNMEYDTKVKKVYYYYDTPDLALLKSNIILYKSVIGNSCELHIANEKSLIKPRYTARTSQKHFTKPIKAHDGLMRHKEFLIESFKLMFLSGVNLDPEFLLKKLQLNYTIKVESLEYRSMNGAGLKILYSFDKDTYINELNKQKAIDNVLTIYQLSGINTNSAFEDLISKLTRYCKELTPTNSSKIMFARAMTATKPKPNEYLTDKNKGKKDAKKKK